MDENHDDNGAEFMNDQGLAIAIIGAMALILVIGLLFGFALSRILVGFFGWGGSKKNIALFGITAIGCGVGMLTLTATFYESSWSPPPQITFVVPPSFSQNWVIVLEDPAATEQLVWKGVEVPFFGKSTAVKVTSTGIVRVQNLGELIGRMDINVKWSDGSSNTAQAGGPAPKSTNATLFSAFNRVTTNEIGPAEPPFGESEALGAHILARESATR
jgi:hypothetical protein